MTDTGHGIGTVGTALRVAVAVGLAYLAGVSWTVEWYDFVGGLAVLPGLTIALGVIARRHGAGAIRFTGPGGYALNCAAIVTLLSNPYTAGAAALFYATTLLIAAWRGQAGCEVTVVSNWILRRDDQVGCPVFAPVDALEAEYRRRRGGPAPGATGTY
jgi:hypothetical protein